MGVIVTVGVFFGYDYVFNQDLDVTLEPIEITSQSIEYSITITHFPDNTTSFLLIVEGGDSVVQVASQDATISGKLTDLDADTVYTFTVYTVSESNQTKVFETELITKEEMYNE